MNDDRPVKPAGDGDPERFTLADGLRYGFLAFLASLLFLVFFGRTTAGLLGLFALYLLTGVGVLLYVAHRKGRI